MVSIESRCIAPRRVPRWVLAAAALGLGLLAGGAAASSPPREILVVTDINYPPFLFETDDGGVQGILKDKWALWSQRTGIPSQVRGMEWIKAQEGVQTGSADIIETLSYTEARAALYEFSPAYAPIEERCREALGDARFEELTARGEAMSHDELVDLVGAHELLQAHPERSLRT